jgi:uncharacterized membrane protein YidH (DUF202 family)
VRCGGADDAHGERRVAGERADLAWSRSGLAALVGVLALAKRVVPDLTTLDARAIVVLSLAVVVSAGGVALVWGKALASASVGGGQLGSPRMPRIVASATVIFGIAAMVVALLPS